MNNRTAIVVTAAAFGVFETVDIPDTGIPALVFALLFFGCAAWLWRRGSRWSAALIGLLLAFEATQAETWRDAAAAAKGFAMVGGVLGIALVGSYLNVRRSPR